MRFRAYLNSGQVTLTIKAGQTIHHSRCEQTDEGYRRDSTTYEADEEGILRTIYRDERDCDGQHSSDHESFCPWDRLHELGGWPDWRQPFA